MGLGNKKAGTVDVLPTKAPVERLPPRHESEAKRNGVNPYGAPRKDSELETVLSLFS